MPRRGRRRIRRKRASLTPIQRSTDQWSGFGIDSNTIAMTISGSTTADKMTKVVSGFLSITSDGPIRAQLVLRGYAPEDELISSRPVVTCGSTASIKIRAPRGSDFWTANKESNHLAWLRVDKGNATKTVSWSYVAVLSFVSRPNNTLVTSTLSEAEEHFPGSHINDATMLQSSSPNLQPSIPSTSSSVGFEEI